MLSRILYQQQQSLPQGTLLADMDTRIADLRLAQFDINQQRDDLFRARITSIIWWPRARKRPGRR